jgi:MerR family transcriptional regulator, thiopeptide resistance regulator
MRTVKELAALAGITVRTLHHYDEIGLLRPSARTDSGYRLYDHDDLLRLQQVLVWRELGFSLADVAALLDDPGYDLVGALESQRAGLAARVDELALVLKRVEAALVEAQGGEPVEEETMFEAFDTSRYDDEVRERWGDTEAYRQSTERMARLTEADRCAIVAEGEDLTRRMAAAYTSGVAAESDAAMDLAEEARRGIERFYDCPPEMHVSLGAMYVDDPRFSAYYDRYADGLAVWLRDAVVANAERRG